MTAPFRTFGLVLTCMAFLQIPSRATAPDLFEWAPGTEHPMKAFLDAAPTLTAETLSLLRQARQPKLDPNALARIPAVSAAAKACLDAKDEFERRRLEGTLKEEVRTAAQAILGAPYLRVVLNAQLGDYAFQAKGFPFRGNGLSYLRNDLVQFGPPGSWPVFPTLLPVAEDRAEAWVKEHPGRRVSVVVLVAAKSLQIHPDRPGLPGQATAQATFSGVFWNDGPGRPQTCIGAFPTPAALTESVLAKAAETVEISRAVDKGQQAALPPRIWERLQEHGTGVQEDTASDLAAAARQVGFKLEADPRVTQALAALQKIEDGQRTTLTTLLKVGRDYQGTQTLPNGVQRPIVLRLTKGNAEKGWMGTCVYGNKRRAVVTAAIRQCQHGPCLNLEFYHPQDNEIGAADGQDFHVVGTQIFGMAMPETLVYHTEVRTRIALK